jgi:hypothetical protein
MALCNQFWTLFNIVKNKQYAKNPLKSFILLLHN